jgi:hypothetical protein
MADDFDAWEGSDPDWGRVGVKPPSAYKQLGDPTRWGAVVTQQVPLTAGVQHVLPSGQIISAQCLDPYARNWSIVGTINSSLWVFPDGFGPVTWSCILNVVMGVGQNQIRHNINLRATVAADAPFYNDDPFVPPGLTTVTRAFVIPGALVASAMSIQVTNVVQYLIPPLPPGDVIMTSLQIAPIAAGTGL